MQQMLDTGRINARHHCYVQRHHRINAMLEPQGYAVQCNKGHATSFVAQTLTVFRSWTVLRSWILHISQSLTVFPYLHFSRSLTVFRSWTGPSNGPRACHRGGRRNGPSRAGSEERRGPGRRVRGTHLLHHR